MSARSSPAAPAIPSSRRRRLITRLPAAALAPGSWPISPSPSMTITCRCIEIFARAGVNLETSALSGWGGATAAALQPLIDALAAEVMASDTLHVDDTPVPVLAPGTGKTKTGRLWTYVRDERPFTGSRPPAALFFYSPDRKGEHPRVHLKDFRGVIHADGYAGFHELFVGGW